MGGEYTKGKVDDEGSNEDDDVVGMDDFKIMLSFKAISMRAVADCKVRSVDDGTCKNISVVDKDIPICQRLERTWKFSPGLLSVDLENLPSSVLKTALDFAMEPLLSILSAVDDEDVTVDEADESLSRWSVVVESIENGTVDSGSVEGNSSWMKDGLRSVSVRLVSAARGTNEPLFQAEISGEE